MKNLFIDTNILLSFYHFSSDDLEELRKLAALVRQGELRLYLPAQVVTEFRRNRANKIADALNRLKSQNLKLQFPQLSKDYDEYPLLRDAQREYSRLHSQLINRIEEDVSSHALQADFVVDELFDLAEVSPTTNELVAKARLRMEIGNPPGKKGSLGDAIIWEALLEAVPDLEDLFFITEDGDYFSPLDEEQLDPFLVQEWMNSKRSELIVYNRLSRFFRANYPDIELAFEIEKETLIGELATSGSFQRTHEIIARLSKYSDFTDAQLNAIALAAATNDQVYWIINDPDVYDFLVSMIKPKEAALDFDPLTKLNEHFGQDVFEPIPF
jgi:predicted nucleic acid-binding protein